VNISPDSTPSQSHAHSSVMISTESSIGIGSSDSCEYDIVEFESINSRLTKPAICCRKCICVSFIVFGNGTAAITQSPQKNYDSKSQLTGDLGASLGSPIYSATRISTTVWLVILVALMVFPVDLLEGRHPLAVASAGGFSGRTSPR
jgi:hypothetical protein